MSPALTRLPSGRIEMIVSGGGAVVGITPWSGRVERKGMCGSTT